MKLSVIIPAHNEEGSVGETIRTLFATLQKEEIPCEILVVNDHSEDKTEEIPALRHVNKKQFKKNKMEIIN